MYVFLEMLTVYFTLFITFFRKKGVHAGYCIMLFAFRKFDPLLSLYYGELFRNQYDESIAL